MCLAPAGAGPWSPPPMRPLFLRRLLSACLALLAAVIPAVALLVRRGEAEDVAIAQIDADGMCDVGKFVGIGRVHAASSLLADGSQ